MNQDVCAPEWVQSVRRGPHRKVATIARVKSDVIAAGNIGCTAQIASASPTPVVELLDWARGGPAPAALA